MEMIGPRAVPLRCLAVVALAAGLAALGWQVIAAGRSASGHAHRPVPRGPAQEMSWVAVLPITLRRAPVPRGLIPLGRLSAPPDERWSGVASSDHLAYVLARGTSFEGVRVIDLADPAAPRLVGGTGDMPLDRPGRPVVDSRRLLIPAGDRGLHIADLTEPTSPRWLATIPAVARTAGVAVAGNLAYVVDAPSAPVPCRPGDEPRSTLRVFDLRDPAAPVLLGALGLPGRAEHVAASGTTVFVATAEAGLRVVNVETPGAPREVAWLDLWGVTRLVIAGDRLLALYQPYFCRMGGDAVAVIDVAVPAAPRVVDRDEAGAPDIQARAVDLAHDGRYVYMGGPFTAIGVLEVSVDGRLRHRDSAWLPPSGSGVAFIGGVATDGGDLVLATDYGALHTLVWGVPGVTPSDRLTSPRPGSAWPARPH